MELRCAVPALREAVASVAGALPRKHPTPVGRSLVLLADRTGQFVQVSGGSLSGHATRRVNAAVTSPGLSAVPLSLLAPLLEHLDPELPVLLRGTQNRLQVVQGRAELRLVTVDPSQATELPVPDPAAPALTIPADAWLAALGMTLPFAATGGEGRGPLRGLAFRAEQGQAVIVASDGHRLSRTTWQGDAPTTPLLFPAELLRQVQDLWPTEGALTLQVDQEAGYAAFQAPDRRLILPLLRETFPPTDTLFRNPTTEMTVARQELLGAVRRVAIVGGAVPRAILDLRPEGLTISTGTGDDVAEVALDGVTVTGQPLTIAVSAPYLRDALRLLPDGPILLAGSLPTHPVRLRSATEGGPRTEMLLMPLRVS